MIFIDWILWAPWQKISRAWLRSIALSYFYEIFITCLDSQFKQLVKISRLHHYWSIVILTYRIFRAILEGVVMTTPFDIFLWNFQKNDITGCQDIRARHWQVTTGGQKGMVILSDLTLFHTAVPCLDKKRF